eukprot:TRINITY_DN5918_c0_g2_i1.p1 TRINITY_DN5918_c0_g2~~TRINITY_DN5918_c0_g2_i1.p1  ORF type:complete len:424 (+),score=116.64 TRINITY_DN5918_c0_g2_i1:82-1272(+)
MGPKPAGPPPGRSGGGGTSRHSAPQQLPAPPARGQRASAHRRRAVSAAPAAGGPSGGPAALSAPAGGGSPLTTDPATFAAILAALDGAGGVFSNPGRRQRTGLSDITIAGLPQFPYTGEAPSSADAWDGDLDCDDSHCIICFEPFAGSRMLMALPCIHKFHADCASDWLRRRADCPKCQQAVLQMSNSTRSMLREGAGSPELLPEEHAAQKVLAAAAACPLPRSPGSTVPGSFRSVASHHGVQRRSGSAPAAGRRQPPSGHAEDPMAPPRAPNGRWAMASRSETGPQGFNLLVEKVFGPQGGGVAWVPDNRVSRCAHCSARFNCLLRKHHCRGCGRVMCANCTPQRRVWGYRFAQRCCDGCAERYAGSRGEVIPPWAHPQLATQQRPSPRPSPRRH